jgi:hypothetical protein
VGIARTGRGGSTGANGRDEARGQGHDRSLGNGVFLDDAVLHDGQKLVGWVSNEVYVFQGIAVDN